MSESLVHRGFPLRVQPHALVIAGLSVALMLTLALVSFNPIVAIIPFAVFGAGFVWWSIRYTTANPIWLALPLIIIELITASWFLSGGMRAAFHYGMTALFCLPLLPEAWRKRTFTHDGYALYCCYFLWAAVTVTYSLAPGYSAARLIDTLLVFGAISYVVSQLKEPDDLTALLAALLIGCGLIVLALIASFFLLPKSMVWLTPDQPGGEYLEVARFCGIFTGPNDVGELMLLTVGCAAVLWPAAEARRKWLIAVLIAMALGAAAMADSRTPFVALAAGAACYALWKYRGRALILLLVLALAAALVHFRFTGDSYVARGDVSTLTGRTDVWEFALRQIKDRPVLGYGYDVAGAILQSRYFPVWWGPWDQGPHSSLHDGYIDRAVGVGLPALLLWVFLILRPWYTAIKRREDRWRLKPILFWMVIPMMIHNLAEVSISDCTGMVGLSFFIIWAVAEKVRLSEIERQRMENRARAAALSPAAAALTGSLLAALIVIAVPACARAQSPAHFPTLPPHAALPSAEYCARTVRAASAWEPRPENSQANHTTPGFAELLAFHLAPLKGGFAPISDFTRVNGRFTGTTDQILRWGACKWGIDEDVVRAEAVAESHWHQDDAGDSTGDRSICPPGDGFPGAWDGGSCQLSYGIMQMKYSSFNGWPLSKDSTAFNVDFRLAYQRACMNGDISYLAQQTPAGDYPRYPYGSTDQILWGCMGDWFSGSWYDAGAIHYINEVKEDLAQRTWARSGF